MAANHGLDICAGVTDPDYRGTTKLVIFNFGEKDYAVQQGERVAQLICEMIVKLEIQHVDKLAQTQRAELLYG